MAVVLMAVVLMVGLGVDGGLVVVLVVMLVVRVVLVVVLVVVVVVLVVRVVRLVRVVVEVEAFDFENSFDKSEKPEASSCFSFSVLAVLLMDVWVVFGNIGGRGVVIVKVFVAVNNAVVIGSLISL